MLKRRLKIVGVLIVAVIASFLLMRYYAYHGAKRDIATEDTAFKVSSNTIVGEFTANLEGSNKKYLEKPVAVSGIITSVNAKEVILDNSVNCNLSAATASLKKDQKVTIKGRVVGYDDLLGELKLDQCSLATE